MSITRQQVEHVADLARLRFEEDELERMTAQLAAILAYMEQLREVDTTGVQPTTHAMELFNVFREDQIRPSMGQQEALANAPKRSGESFQVPRVIE
ncbi:MAG: Asp-tRNA(Asn)/Glu-tRNA(Gln) amidotransferase subunit GatC [Thermodesulfobacteriota bacterium]